MKITNVDSVPSPVEDVQAGEPLTSVSSSPRIQDSLESAQHAHAQSAQTQPSRRSWSYCKIAIVACISIAALTVGALILKYFLRREDHAAEFQSRIERYRQELRGDA